MIYFIPLISEGIVLLEEEIKINLTIISQSEQTYAFTPILKALPELVTFPV